jgi:predicted RNA-binding Zn-ribbon protein involved in translation (DUF1610 family)
MELPVPIFFNDLIYNEVEIQKPRGGVIADTQRILDSTNDYFTAMKIFLSGCITSITDIDGKEIKERSSINSIVGKMPYRTAEYLSVKIMLFLDSDDAVEGIYTCPRCGFKVISELIKDGDMEIDTRDYISDLEINYMKDFQKKFSIDLTTPVELKEIVREDQIQVINSMTFEQVTLEHGIKAFRKFGTNDKVRLQYAIYLEALTEINGIEIDNKYKNRYGMTIFNNIEDVKVNIGKIFDEINKYGMDNTIEKNCTSCGRVWRSTINTSNFFGSALLSA